MAKKKKTVYLDHAAATPMDPSVQKAMAPYQMEYFGNPSALYSLGVASKKALETARESVANFLSVTPDTIFFTRGGTESINMAILGAARKHATHGKHIITTAVEHHAVLEPLAELEKEGFEVTRLPVDEHGFVSADSVREALREDTTLVSIMYANNEIGTVEPIQAIGKEILKWRKEKKTAYPIFHSDACQATNYLSMHVPSLHTDLLSFNGSKIYGPKSTGVLYKARHTDIEPILFGGGQEMGLRSGTEDVGGAVGLAQALKRIQNNKEKEIKRIQALRDELWQRIQKEISNAHLNGPELNEGVRLPNNLSVAFPGTDSEALVLYLDAKGIAASFGSACATDTLEPSHVLKACGLDDKRIRGTLRLTLGRDTKKKRYCIRYDIFAGNRSKSKRYDTQKIEHELNVLPAGRDETNQNGFVPIRSIRFIRVPLYMNKQKEKLHFTD